MENGEWGLRVKSQVDGDRLLKEEFMQNKYCINKFYRARNEYHHFDDLSNKDEWQLEVYLHALGLMIKHNLSSIVDIGCGSGYKLMTYLGNYKTVGIELPINTQILKRRYPDKEWVSASFSERLNLSADVIISADVIEHLLDPDELLTFINSISFKYLVISTPERKLVYKRPWIRGYWGPPRNPAHQREWSFAEFNKYLSLHFDVIDQRVTNLEQKTQMAICIKK